jgi:hypothetical protein
VAERYLAAITPRRLYLVTSPFHLDRSLKTFELVLGPAWPILGVASGPVSDDPERARNEQRFLEQTRLWLADMTPGDIAAIAAKLRRRPDVPDES